jgi:hypothetical protein
MILWVLLFFVTGILLIFAEFFLPGLVLGTIGGMLLIISGALGVYHYPDYALFIIIGEVAGVGLGVVLGVLCVIPYTGGRPAHPAGSAICRGRVCKRGIGYVPTEL